MRRFVRRSVSRPSFAPSACSTIGRRTAGLTCAIRPPATISNALDGRALITSVCSVSADDFAVAEEEADFIGRGFGRIRAMHRVGLDVLREILADGSGCGLFRIGRAHDL